MGRDMRSKRKAELSLDRQQGLTLVEVTVALGFFVILLLSVSMTLVAGMRQRRETFEWYQAMTAARDMLAEMQETANEPQDLAKNDGIGAEYRNYNLKTFTVSRYGLTVAPTVSVAVYPDESTIPGTLGGTQDLNFDGDKADNLGNASAGTDLKLIPAILTVTYVEGNRTATMTVPRLITKTTD